MSTSAFTINPPAVSLKWSESTGDLTISPVATLDETHLVILDDGGQGGVYSYNGPPAAFLGDPPNSMRALQFLPGAGPGDGQVVRYQGVKPGAVNLAAKVYTGRSWRRMMGLVVPPPYPSPSSTVATTATLAADPGQAVGFSLAFGNEFQVPSDGPQTITARLTGGGGLSSPLVITPRILAWDAYPARPSGGPLRFFSAPTITIAPGSLSGSTTYTFAITGGVKLSGTATGGGLSNPVSPTRSYVVY